MKNKSKLVNRLSILALFILFINFSFAQQVKVEGTFGSVSTNQAILMGTIVRLDNTSPNQIEPSVSALSISLDGLYANLGFVAKVGDYISAVGVLNADGMITITEINLYAVKGGGVKRWRVPAHR